jgi:copper ion binding protein
LTRFGKEKTSKTQPAQLAQNAAVLQAEEPEEEPLETEAPILQKTLKIQGMMCKHCVGRVEKALLAVDGVSTVAVDLENGSAEIYLTSHVADEAIAKAIVDAGYEVLEIKATK